MKINNPLQTIDERTVLGSTIRIYGSFEEPLYLARDVARLLGYRRACEMTRLAGRGQKTLAPVDAGAAVRRMTLLTEAGLRSVMNRSHLATKGPYGVFVDFFVAPRRVSAAPAGETAAPGDTAFKLEAAPVGLAQARGRLAELTADLGVTERDGRVVVSSLDVARTFGKGHKDVLKAIRGLECSSNFQERNFALMSRTVEVANGAQKKVPYYMMTRDGFLYLAFGFTGKKAAALREAYIEAFNAMEAALRERERSGMPPAALRELAAAATQITTAVTELARLTAELAGVTAAVARRQDDVDRRCAALERRLAPRPARPTPENQLNLFMRPHDLLDEARRDLHQPREEREPVRTSSYTTIGPRLRELRKEHYNMSPDEFAELTGVTATTLMAIEAGISRPGLGTLSRLRLRTGVSADWLLFGEGPVHPVSKDYTIAPFTGA